MQPRDFAFGLFDFGCGAVGEQIRQSFEDDRFPLTNLRGMNLIIPRYLGERFAPVEGFEPHFGLKGHIMSFSLVFHWMSVSALRAGSSDTNFSILASGLNFGVHHYHQADGLSLF